jgi:hypothetical protein
MYGGPVVQNVPPKRLYGSPRDSAGTAPVPSRMKTVWFGLPCAGCSGTQTNRGAWRDRLRLNTGNFPIGWPIVGQQARLRAAGPAILTVPATRIRPT